MWAPPGSGAGQFLDGWSAIATATLSLSLPRCTISIARELLYETPLTMSL
jgi:hypothetical protein